MPRSLSVWKVTGDEKRLWTRTETDWEKVEDLWLPSKLSLKLFSLHHDSAESFDLTVQSKLGSDLPGKIPLILESADWREPVRGLFNENWQRRGIVPPLLEKSDD